MIHTIARYATLLAVLLTVVATPATAQRDSDDRAQDLYHDARALLRDGEYLPAAEGFENVAKRYPDDDLAAKALYWQAFALLRDGDRRSLREATKVLERQFDLYPAQARRGDSDELAMEIRGELAERGDAQAAAEIARVAELIRGEESSRDRENQGRDRENGRDLSDNTKIAALNALMQMNPERAQPILRKILIEQPDKYSETVRVKAVFIASQNDDEGAIELLSYAISHDSSREVREQAVFWLSQTDDEGAIEILEQLARRSDEDESIRGKAIFALSQIGGERSNLVLRDIALDDDSSMDLRANAVFWIGQSDDRHAVDFLIDLYHGTDEADLKDKAIFSVSQIGGRGASEFLGAIVRDAGETTELRTQALFWLGQTGDVDVEAVVELFHTIDDPEVRGQVVFVLSQLGSRQSVQALIDIARDADDHDLRENAIFWLGQSDDDRATEFLADLIAEEF